MNFDQFAASFQNPEGTILRGEEGIENEVVEVVIAGTILTATKESCCFDVNDAVYEISPSDVIDIEVLSPTDSGKEGEDRDDTEDAPSNQGPQLALIKMNSDAVLWRRIPVQAAAVAAVGTWLSIVPPAPEADSEAEEPVAASK